MDNLMIKLANKMEHDQSLKNNKRNIARVFMYMYKQFRTLLLIILIQFKSCYTWEEREILFIY